MNIFNRVALQALKKSRTRTIVTIIGVALSAAMITAVTTFGISMLNYMIKGAMDKYGGWHVAFTNVDHSFVQQECNHSSVADSITIDNMGYAMISDIKDTIVKKENAKKANKSSRRPYLFIAGYSKEAFNKVPLNLYSGRLPENSNEIVISGKVQTKENVKLALGDTITLSIGNRMKDGKILGQQDAYVSKQETFQEGVTKTYTVVGICQSPVYEPDSAPGYTAITMAESDVESENVTFFATLKKPMKVRNYIKSVAVDQKYILNDNVLRFMGLSEDTLFNTILYAVGGIVIAIIMVGSIFLIYNSFNISLNERTHQFGILASIGATAKQLRNSVLFEGLCIGAIGIPIGILVGIGGIGLVISVVANSFGNIIYDNVSLTLTISIPTILLAAIVSLLTILISAYIPAGKAARIPVMECIRQTNEIKVEERRIRTSNLTQHIYGLEGTLAIKNFKRNKKQYRSIVLSLVLSVVLFISVNSFVLYMKKGAESVTTVTTYDIGLGTQTMKDSDLFQLYDKLKGATGVYESSYQIIKEYSCKVKASDLSKEYWKSMKRTNQLENEVDLPVQIQFIDDSTFKGCVTKLNLSIEEHSLQEPRMIAVGKILGDSQSAQDNDMKDLFANTMLEAKICPKVDGKTVGSEENPVKITLVNTMLPDMPPTSEVGEQKSYMLNIIAPYSLLETYEAAGIQADTMMKGITFLSKHPEQSLAQMNTMIKEIGISSDYTLVNMKQMLSESRNYVFIANVFSYAFLIMISLIAVANVFNTISTNIKMRRRELAMLRSVGMSDHDFQKMMNYECVFYGMRALVLGLPIALLASYGIYKTWLLAGMSNIHYIFPLKSVVISISGVLLIVFITMLYTINKIKDENIINALRDDME